MSKPRYFHANVQMYIRLDNEASDPEVTLNGALQLMEDQMGNIACDTSDIQIVRIPKKAAPKELKP